MTSLKTTLTGIAALLTIAAGVVNLLTDGNPVTNPDWNAVVAGAVTALGLIFARDNKVTSEQVLGKE